MATKKSTSHWSDVKNRLADFDRAGLLRLVQDLYAASKDNQTFMHARFGLGDDPLESYKDAIVRWINPPDLREPVSVSKAKKAISDYKKASGQLEGLAELSLFYCEEAFALLAACGMDDASFYDALVRMFEQSLKYARALSTVQQAAFLGRLDAVRQQGHHVGWGVGEDFDHIWSQAGLTRLE